jgi:amino acid permease
MLKATIGLGVLAIPYSFQTVGLIPGILLLTFVIIIVTWSDVVVGTFKQNHPGASRLPWPC